MKVYLYAILILLLMILAVGWFFVDKFKDLYDEANQPNNPEEAIAYMENREKEGPRVIPVYKKDGKTIIGQYTLQ